MISYIGREKRPLGVEGEGCRLLVGILAMSEAQCLEESSAALRTVGMGDRPFRGCFYCIYT